MSIGYAYICSSVQDHKQKFISLRIQVLVLKEQKRAKELAKEAYVARQSLKTT
jgi:hypothetical protein